MVINLDDKGKAGTHWVAARLTPSGTLIYCDPFGTILEGYPPEELSNMPGKKRELTNSVAFQRLDTNYCGYYAMLFAKEIDHMTGAESQRALEKSLAYCVA
jgi:hypothetical protein